MKNRQDYIQLGSSAPIVLAPYETVPIGGLPTIQVMDPDLYIRVRDILLARQLSLTAGLEAQRPLGWPEPASESLGEPTAPEQTQEFSAVQVEASELGKYVDQMLDTLRGNDLLQASRILMEVMGYLGGDRDELRQIVGIFGKVLGNHLRKSQTNEETRNE